MGLDHKLGQECNTGRGKIWALAKFTPRNLLVCALDLHWKVEKNMQTCGSGMCGCGMCIFWGCSVKCCILSFVKCWLPSQCSSLAFCYYIHLTLVNTFNELLFCKVYWIWSQVEIGSVKRRPWLHKGWRLNVGLLNIFFGEMFLKHVLGVYLMYNNSPASYKHVPGISGHEQVNEDGTSLRWQN